MENLIQLSIVFLSHLVGRMDEDERQATHFKVVEFCAGSGFVCLPLAALYPRSFYDSLVYTCIH